MARVVLFQSQRREIYFERPKIGTEDFPEYRRKNMIMNKLLVTVLTLGAISIGPSLYGQAAQPDPQSQEKQQPQADRPSGEQSLTGCLTEAAGSYTLATSGGEQVNLTGSPDLSKHKDHTITVTGTKSDAGGKATMRVSKIEHVSASCAK
jgi:hypothetical protein